MRSWLLILLVMTGQSLTGQVLLREAKFKTGNDAAWSQPQFDDSKWVTLQTNHTWDDQGFKDYNGYAWYRIHTRLSSVIRDQAAWKDSIRINLGKIDDVDEVYLNGQLIGKKGSSPQQPGGTVGYVTAWDQVREYHLSVFNPIIKWDAENVIAIKVYDGGGPGGMFGGDPYIAMMDLIDGIKIEFRPTQVNSSNKLSTPIVVSNSIRQP